MVLVNSLCVMDAAVELRHVVLREANEGLDVHEYVERKTEACMRRFKVLVSWPGFVHLDYDEAGGEGAGPEDMEKEVGECAGALLGGCVCWL